MRWKAQTEWWRGGVTPRAWQAEALDAAIRVLVAQLVPVCVQAVMGAGKSVLIAEFVAQAELERDEVVVITTSTQRLVEQLAEDIGQRIGPREVGRFYGRAKEATRRVLVACLPSAGKLAEVLQTMGRRVGLLIIDEAHRSECGSMLEAHAALAPQHTLGLTATPYRADEGEELSLFRELVYRYGPREAVRDGVVVPWDVRPWTGRECTVDEACAEMIAGARELGPGVVNAVNVSDATAFAERLEDAGVRVGSVHSKNSASANDAAIARLERGELDCIVHVSMLQEGVNLPWLRWLCLRRPVSSRVRFAQEVGRVLRSYPGKDTAIIFDPLDLFAEHSLSYDAVLYGQAEDAGTAAANRPVDVRRPSDEAAQLFMKLPESALANRTVEVLDAATVYLRRTTLDLELAGALQRRIASHSWRHRAPTSDQMRLVANLLERCRPHADALPDHHRTALRHACRVAGRMNRGQVSDLISLLITVQRSRGWPLRGAVLEATDSEVAA